MKTILCITIIDDVSDVVLGRKHVKRDFVAVLRNQFLPGEKKNFMDITAMGNHSLIPMVRNGQQYFHTYSLQIWVTVDISQNNAFIHNSIELHIFAEPVKSAEDHPVNKKRFSLNHSNYFWRNICHIFVVVITLQFSRA